MLGDRDTRLAIVTVTVVLALAAVIAAYLAAKLTGITGTVKVLMQVFGVVYMVGLGVMLIIRRRQVVARWREHWLKHRRRIVGLLLADIAAGVLAAILMIELEVQGDALIRWLVLFTAVFAAIAFPATMLLRRRRFGTWLPERNSAPHES